MKLSVRRKIAVRKYWTCPTCNGAVSTSFCPDCGEHPLRAHDLTLRGFLGQMVQTCTNIDGPFLRSLRCLVSRPGVLTVAYLEGQRKAYTPPLQLFLVANVLFFAMQSLTGAKIFSTPLDQHLHSDIWGSVAQQSIPRHLEMRHTTLDLYAPIFDQAVALNAKSLIVVMVLPFALLPALLFYRRHRPFVVHMVFSLHFYAFLLLLLCVSLTVLGISLMFGGPGLESEDFDHVLSIVELALCAVYLHFAVRTVYAAQGVSRILKVGALAFAVAGIFLGYRFALLLITLSAT